MPADLEGRLRQVLRPEEPPVGSEERMLNRVIAAPGNHRTSGRPSRRGAFAAAAMIAAAAAFLVLMLPRGDRHGSPSPPAAFTVLGGGSPSDLTTLGVRVEDLRFPGLDPSTLRTVRVVGDTTVLVGLNRDGLVCLTLIGPEPGVPPREQPGQVIVTRTRAFTQCGLPGAVERSAVVQHTWTGETRPVLLLPDGVRLRTSDGPVSVTDNVAVLEPGTESVTATYADGVTRRLRTDERVSLPLAAADRAAIRSVPVPDLAGVDAGEAARLLDASLLTSGATTVEPSSDVPPGHVLRQSSAPGTSASPGMRIDMVLASPGGPRDEPPPVTPVVLDALGSRPGGPVLSRTTLGALRGTPRVLIFVRTRQEAASARWVPQTGIFAAGAIVVVFGARERAAEVGNGDTSAGLAVDPSGELASVLGVRAPATVVLDRQGRIAVRAAGLPAGPEPDPDLDLGAIVSTLQAEPTPVGGSSTKPPASAWWLTSRAPVAAAEVASRWPLNLPCDADRTRVWAFGPVGGHRMWIALSYAATPDGTLGQLVMVEPEPWNTQAPVSVSSCGPFASITDASPAVPMWIDENDGVTRRIFVVRNGYDRAEGGGRTYPIVNGMLMMVGSDLPRDEDVTLVGPSGRTPLT